MKRRKVHLREIMHTDATLCGINTANEPYRMTSIAFAKSYKKVTCKRCMCSETYKSYLAGKFIEKPDTISQRT